MKRKKHMYTRVTKVWAELGWAACSLVRNNEGIAMLHTSGQRSARFEQQGSWIMMLAGVAIIAN